MNIDIIRATFETRLSAWASAQPIAAAWENVAYTPDGSSYLRAYLLPAATVSNSLCGAEFKGIYQINVFAQAGKGPGTAAALARSLAELFAAGLTINGVSVPKPPSIRAGADDPSGYYKVPVDIPYFAT